MKNRLVLTENLSTLNENFILTLSMWDPNTDFIYRVTTRENYNYTVTYRENRIEKNNHLPLNDPSDYFKMGKYLHANIQRAVK